MSSPPAGLLRMRGIAQPFPGQRGDCPVQRISALSQVRKFNVERPDEVSGTRLKFFL